MFVKKRHRVYQCSMAFFFLYLPLTAVLGYGIKGIRSRVALTQLVANG